MKLIAKKGGNGYTSSFTVNISLNDAKNCNFIDENNVPKEIEKIVDAKNNQIIIKLKN